MTILTVSGSSRVQSSNAALLAAIAQEFPTYSWTHFTDLSAMPLFQAEQDRAPWPEKVLEWRTALQSAEALIITTPEYIHNIPAVLKNALEWTTSSGELSNKPVLPITFTPHPPRGERAMQSLLWSLEALDARVVAQMPLYQNEFETGENGLLFTADHREMLAEGLRLLTGN